MVSPTTFRHGSQWSRQRRFRRHRLPLHFMAFLVLLIIGRHTQGDTLYVSNAFDLPRSIEMFDSVGTLRGELTADLIGPWSIAVDHVGNVYVADLGASSVEKFASDGTYVGSITNGDYLPMDVAVDENDNVYVANEETVERYSPEGTYLGSFATGLGFASSLAFDSRGNLLVMDDQRRTVERFDTSGNPLGTVVSGISTNSDLAVDRHDNIYVNRNDADEVGIERYDAAGVSLGMFVRAGNLFLDMAFDQEGRLYTAEFGGPVRRFDLDGSYLGVFARPTSAVGIAFAPVDGLIRMDVSFDYDGLSGKSKYDVRTADISSWNDSMPANGSTSSHAIRAVPEPSAVLSALWGAALILITGWAHLFRRT